MKKVTVSTKWIGNLAFEANVSGHRIILDADPGYGGKKRGPGPKLLMLPALGGCTGMDVIAILKKMRIEVEQLNVTVEGFLTEEHPVSFYKMNIIYRFSGKNLPMEKLRHAVNLSGDKYCGVSAVYKKAMEITTEIVITD